MCHTLDFVDQILVSPNNYNLKMIPTNNPLRAIDSQREEIDEAIARVLSSGWLILGPENDALSAELSEYLGCQHTVLVGNGTDALKIALLSLGIKVGERVVTVANAGGYASAATRDIGAIPVYVDIREGDLEMDIDGPFGLEKLLTYNEETPSAIVVTHLFGKAAPIERISEIAARHNIPVVEDCAQSLGAEVGGKKLGTFGDVATTSFYPTKNLGALGDGGAIFTSNSYIAERARSLRQYGWTDRYISQVAGGQNSRLDEIQAAVLRLRLRKVEESNRRRREIQQRYKDAANQNRTIEVPHSFDKSYVAHLAVILLANRGRAQKQLEAMGISTDIHYPMPDYQQGAFADFAPQPLPITERQASRILTLPLFPEMNEAEIQRVEEALSSITP